MDVFDEVGHGRVRAGHPAAYIVGVMAAKLHRILGILITY